jgi:hypothetical protein
MTPLCLPLRYRRSLRSHCLEPTGGEVVARGEGRWAGWEGRLLRLMDMRDRLRERPYSTGELAALYGRGRQQMLRDVVLLQSAPLYTPLVYERKRWHWLSCVRG